MIKEFFKKLFGIKDKELEYPQEFIIVDFSPEALRENVLDNQNKIIYRYFQDGFGNVLVKKYPYSISRLKALQEVYHLPFTDKTKGEIRFPIWAKILPSEITYTTR